MSKTLYEQDYGLWAEQMADLIEGERFGELDIDNLVEEVRDLSKRERDRLLSSMCLIVHHLLKWDYQPQKRSWIWQTTIQRERNNILFYLRDSPSLKRYLTDDWLGEVYINVRLNGIKATGLDLSERCSYSIQDVLERDVGLVY